MPVHTMLLYTGLGFVSLIFFANALGIVDQARPVQEMRAAGIPERLAYPAVMGGRLLQLAASIGLFFPQTRAYAALALVVFLVLATLMAHAFWKAPPEQRAAQLTNFLKNSAIVGGLLFIAGCRL